MSHMGGPTYLFLGMGTSSPSSNANAFYVYTESQPDNALSAKANKLTTYTQREEDVDANTKSNRSDMAIAFGSKASASYLHATSQVDGQIDDLLYGIMEFYDDDTGTWRGVVSHSTSLQFALTQSVNPTGAPIIMTMSQASGVVVNTALSVGGDFYAPSLYNTDQVDDIANKK